MISGKKVQIRAEIYYISKNPSVTRCSIGADCLTSLKILKILTVGLKKWILVMLSRIVTYCKHCQILIRSPLKVKSLHLLSNFRGCIFNGFGE